MLKDDDYKRISFRFAPYLAWTSLIHLSHGQIFIGDEEFVILVTFEPKKDPGFSFPCEANPEFDFDENAESERLAKIQNTWSKDLLSRFPYSAWFIYYSRILRSSWISACC